MAEASTQSPIDVQWRHLSKYLWVARRDDHPIGMIEQGSHYVATDDDGNLLGRFSDLASAQAAFDAHRPEAAVAAEAAQRRRVWHYVTGGAALLVAAAGTSAAVLLH
ncbi:hypothetical protein [uncultured Amnibacterium sp.]|uniref:hypothetical protein n=1 Tax=uncultured Amnibacterium sp. TaxID=1631851 RepID=UPI0035C9AC3A